jgi:hypothetical protein
VLTDYFVHCPHADCHWKGCIFPQGKRDSHSPLAPTNRDVVFLCPSCRRTWNARIVGDDAIPLPLSDHHLEAVPAGA